MTARTTKTEEDILAELGYPPGAEVPEEVKQQVQQRMPLPPPPPRRRRAPTPSKPPAEEGWRPDFTSKTPYADMPQDYEGQRSTGRSEG